MALSRVQLNSRGMNELLHSKGVERELDRRAQAVKAQAQSFAPVQTGAYKASIRVAIEQQRDRVVAEVIAGGGFVFYAAILEARLRILGRAIDAAR